MSDTAHWKGRRLGPYLMGERYPGIPEDEGRLYEAHHVDTGEPALVVMPGTGDDWRTYTPWSVLAMNRTEPKALVLHPQLPAGRKLPSFHELTLGFIRLAGLLARLDERRDVRAPFEREPRPSHRRAARWALAGATVALAAGLALLLWPHAPTSMDSRDMLDDSPFFTDGQDLTAPGIAYPMPEKPFKQQRTPPCAEGLEVEVRGGCWIRHEKPAPCPLHSAEYQGRCYVPVRKPDPQPRSIQP